MLSILIFLIEQNQQLSLIISMKILTNLFKFGFRNISIHTTRALLFKPTATFVQTARDIEQKMREQRNKNLNNTFRSLQTSFGLNRPQAVNTNYPRPDRIQFTMQSLRKCSHMYPDYLLKQLQNSKSQFYEVIEASFTGLATAQNKQSIQFLQFMVSWQLYQHSQQFTGVIVRKIYQMELNLGELFQLLKMVVKIDNEVMRNKIMVDVQNKILKGVIDIDQSGYQNLFKILNFMRINDLAPKVTAETVKAVMKKPIQPVQLTEEQKEKYQQEKQGKAEAQESDKKQQSNENIEQQVQINDESFYKIVETVLLRNLHQIPLPNLVEMIVHYANNIKQDQDDKIQILKKVQSKVIQNFSFFNHDELIAIMYSYVKTQSHSQKFLSQFIRRIQLLYFQIGWQNKRKLISLASAFPYNKWMYMVGLSIFQVLKGKKVIHRDGQIQTDPNAKQVQYQLLPAIYQAAYQTNLITTQLVQKLQPRILQNMFNYPAEDIGLISWLFTITPESMTSKRQNKDMLYTKLQAIIVGGFNAGTFTLRDISMVVWSMCNTRGKTNFVYKQNADFWNNIELYIQQRIANTRQEKLLNGCCQILWAYKNNKPLTFKTVNMITDIIVQLENTGKMQQQMFNFQLNMITSFYYLLKNSLPKSIMEYIQKLSLKYFPSLVHEMDYLQIMSFLKFILYDFNDQLQPSMLSDDLWSKILQQFDLQANRIEYSYIMGVISFIIISPQGHKKQEKAVSIVTKLLARKKQLQQLRTTHQ